MKKTLTATLALVADFIGGLLTRYIAPPVALAQNQPPITKEIRAQSFTLVDRRTTPSAPSLMSQGLPSPLCGQRRHRASYYGTRVGASFGARAALQFGP